MVHVHINNNIYKLFIKQDSIDYDIIQNIFKFTAIPMIGVIALYKQSSPVSLNLDGSETSVPKKIKFDDVLRL